MCSSSSSLNTATATSAVRPSLRHRPRLPYVAGAQIAPSCVAGVEVPAASLPSLDAFLCVVLIQPITATWAAQARRISHPEYEPTPTARLPNTAGEARRRASGDTEDGHRLRDHRGARPIGLIRTSEAPLTRHLPRSWRTPSSRLRRSTCRLRRPSRCRSPSRSSGSSPSGNSSSRPSASRSSAPPRRDRPWYAEMRRDRVASACAISATSQALGFWFVAGGIGGALAGQLGTLYATWAKHRCVERARRSCASLTS